MCVCGGGWGGLHSCVASPNFEYALNRFLINIVMACVASGKCIFCLK